MIPAQEQACQPSLHGERGAHEAPELPENLSAVNGAGAEEAFCSVA